MVASTASERITAEKRLSENGGIRRPYRLLVVSTPEKPAPFFSVVAGGYAFHEVSSRMVPDPRRPGHDKEEERPGLIVMMTEEEAADLAVAIQRFVVRWINKDSMTAQVIDVDPPKGKQQPVFPDTDEPLAPYVRIEPVTA